MRCPTFDFEAYRTSWELEKRINPIRHDEDAAQAKKYRFLLRVPTLVSATEWAAETEIGIDVDVVDYPRRQPNTFILSTHTPWSPHFKPGAPVCIGAESWEARNGHVVLGDLVVHLQRLLNWDEKGRGSGYQGWNGAAIDHHRRVLGGRPLNASVVYAQLPGWLHGEVPGLEFDVEVRNRRNRGFEVL
ncbi:hypothetical protein FHS29_002403 [Saccharothrix tamanrassetensis]|uniref:UBC core domain-containing protein n=1 Tax=Saccharothrix tamanrassetensis TaxID=1051531 RepID=A0A841CBC9_9PSEU|nr:hypothetical protein [Saccharothrix tamanrassetensis]MBB5955822.1 hypothetical protein [Saccharothrix tamanrassetensis]